MTDTYLFREYEAANQHCH